VKTVIDYMLEACVCGEEANHEDPDPGCRPLVTRDALAWHICGRCGGDGTLGGFPGAYTESDRAEWSAEDYDDYRSHRRSCENCDGTGKVLELDEEVYDRPEVARYCRDYYNDMAVERQERAMGA
jgi:hypothetical protein